MFLSSTAPRRALAEFDFIEGLYNTRRRHSELGCLSSAELERARLADAAGDTDEYLDKRRAVWPTPTQTTPDVPRELCPSCPSSASYR